YGRVDHASYRASLVFSSRKRLQTDAGPFFFFKIAPLRSLTGALRIGDFRFPLEAIEVESFGPEGGRRQDLLFKGRARSLGASATIEGKLSDVYTGGKEGVLLALRFEHGGKLFSLLPDPLRGW